jgi:hypothetical protein
LSPNARWSIRALRVLRGRALIDALVGRQMRRDLLTSWGISQGRHVLGVKTPSVYFDAIARYTTAEVAPDVSADAPLLAGAEDHYVPPHQLGDQLRALTHARSVTARVFTREEYVQNHAQVGDIGLSVRIILDWLAGLDERDRALGRASTAEWAPGPPRHKVDSSAPRSGP